MTTPETPDPSAQNPLPPAAPTDGQEPPTRRIIRPGAPIPAPGQVPGFPQAAGYATVDQPGQHISSPRPVTITVAAVLGFVVGALDLLAAILGFSTRGVGGLVTSVSVASLIVSIGLVYGAVLALAGKESRTLTLAAGVLAVLQLIIVIGHFNVVNLIVLIIAVAVVIMTLQAASRTWMLARGGKTY